MSPSVTHSWTLNCPLVGLAWLEGPSLAVIQGQGNRTLIHVYNQQGEHCFWCPKLTGSCYLST